MIEFNEITNIINENKIIGKNLKEILIKNESKFNKNNLPVEGINGFAQVIIIVSIFSIFSKCFNVPHNYGKKVPLQWLNKKCLFRCDTPEFDIEKFDSIIETKEISQYTKDNEKS